MPTCEACGHRDALDYLGRCRACGETYYGGKDDAS